MSKYTISPERKANHHIGKRILAGLEGHLFDTFCLNCKIPRARTAIYGDITKTAIAPCVPK